MTRHITTAQTTSVAHPSQFFARWADVASWPKWSADIAWARLDAPFAVGSSGVLKPKKGLKTRVVIEHLEPERLYVDVSRLPGARLTFHHAVTPREGGCTIEVRVWIDGRAARVWSRQLGEGFRNSTPADLDRLVTVVEAGP
jgi:hypothetical protein